MNIYYLKKEKNISSTYILDDKSKSMFARRFTIKFSDREYNIVKNTIEYWTVEQHEVCEVLHEMICADSSIEEAREYLNDVKCIVYEKDIKRRYVYTSKEERQRNKVIQKSKENWDW